MLSEEGFALVSVSMEALLYGVYVVHFIFALALLTWYRRPLSIDWFVVAVTTLLFALCTAHVVLEAMGKLSPLETSHPNLDIRSLRLAANFLYGIISFVSQFILIFRCWAIWDHCKRIVFLPITISVASLACIMTRQGLTASTYSPSFMSSHLASLDTSSFSLSLALDVLVTSLIIFRLWRMSSEVRSIASCRQLFYSVSVIFIEAGVLLVVAQLLVMVLFQIGHPAQVIVDSMAVQVYGIASTLMIIRLAMTLLPTDHGLTSTNLEFTTFLQGDTTQDSSHVSSFDLTCMIELDDKEP